MSKEEIIKQKETVRRYREAYLIYSKKYANLLSEASKLDKQTFSVVRDIVKAGNNISVYDSKTITDIYNSLVSKSKVNRKYYDMVEKLEKAKSSLDNQAYRLFNGQVDLALLTTGIPKKKHNLELLKIAELVNSKKTSLIEKIAYALPYIKDEVLEFESYIQAKEIVIDNGQIKAATRNAKSFLKGLEQMLIQRINNEYFGSKSLDIRRVYVTSFGKNNNLMQLVANVGDKEHIREMERRLTAGDVIIDSGKLVPLTQKGSKYLSLLSEEMYSLLENKINKILLSLNMEAKSNDPLIRSVVDIINDYETRLESHSKISGKLQGEGQYHRLVNDYRTNLSKIVNKKDLILSDLDKLSSATLEIRKKIMLLVENEDISIEDSLPIIAALKLLSNFEHSLDSRILEVSKKLKSSTPANDFTKIVPSLTDIRERYSQDTTKYIDQIDRQIETVLSNRQYNKDGLLESIRASIGNSELVDRYLEICQDQTALLGFLKDNLLFEEKLYQGNEAFQTVLTEIVEKELERREVMAEITHDVQLAHKRFWLKDIELENGKIIKKNLAKNEVDITFGKSLNSKMLSEIQEQISSLVYSYRQKHNEHLDKFLLSLRRLSMMVDQGKDLNVIVSELKQEYCDLDRLHKEEMASLEQEMTRLDEQLAMLPDKSRKIIEKSLISDIKKRVI